MSLFRALLAKRRRGGTVTGTTLITINDITVAEDAGIATFTITRSGDTSGVSSVDYATTQYTAVAGQDYVATSGTLTFTAGQTSKTVDITINNTTNYEVNELFYLDLTNTVGATLSKTRGICTLTDVSGFPSASSVTSPTASEGNNITFRVDFPRYAQFSVPHTYTLSGTAAAGVDYNFTPISIINNLSNSATAISATSSGGSFTAPVNTMWLDITFALLADASAESAETIILTVDGTASGTGTITDVPPPTISTVSSPSATEGGNLVFTVTRTGTGGATINYAYSLGGTASAPSDYTATPTLSDGVTISGGNFVVPAAVTSFTATFATVVNGDNNETVILTVGGVSGTGTIVDLGSSTYGDSLSTKVLTTDILDSAATTDTINLYDGEANGNFFIVPPASGTFTKTIHKSGSANSLGFAKSRIGYARIEGHNTSSPKYRIGNADQTLNASHCFMMLIRINRDDTTTGIENFAGEFELLKTTQTDGFGNPLFKIAIAGSTFATATRRRLVTVQRSGILTATPGPLYECAGSSGSTTYSASVFGSGGPTGANWAWVMAVGFSASDATWLNHVSLVSNSASSLASERIHAGYALHGSDFLNAGSVAIRDSVASGLNITNLSYNHASTNYVTGNDEPANPGKLINVDFVIGGSNHASTTRIVDVARVVKLNTLPDANAIAMICSGMHPQNMGLMSGDDFCLDFDALPANTTLIQGTNAFNPAEDGPVCTDYFGNNATDITMSVTNRRVA